MNRSREEEMRELADTVEGLLVPSVWDKERYFLPLRVQKEFITEESIGKLVDISTISSFEDAREAISMLVLRRKLDLLEQLCRHGLENDDIPLARGPRGTNSLVSKRGKIYALPGPGDCNSLCEKQWACRVPVFNGAIGASRLGQLHESSILPIVDTSGKLGKGGSGEVYKVTVHPDYLQNTRLLLRVNHTEPSKSGYVVALKKISTRADSLRAFAKEEAALIKTQRLEGDHLVKMICSFRRSTEYFFLFPVAEGGDLSTMWKCLSGQPRTETMIKWILAQMEGISGAIRSLNQYSDEENARHGDLKPGNILHFLDSGDKQFGILRVADLGLAKFHGEVTRNRDGPTTETSFTKTYAPPEGFKEGQKRSRQYDVWSLGCVYLEFTVWVFGGDEEVKCFQDQRKPEFSDSSPFFQTKTSIFNLRWNQDILHPAVSSYFVLIRNHRRCKPGSGFYELITLIEDHLLQPKVSNRFTTDKVERELHEISAMDNVKSGLYEGTSPTDGFIRSPLTRT